MTTLRGGPPLDHPELGDNPISDRLNNAFRSARLIYRAIEPNDEDADMLYRFNSDPDPAISSSIGWPRPYSKERGRNHAQECNAYKNDIIVVFACLDPDKKQPGLSEELLHPARAKAADDKNDQKPKPVPIGLVALRAAFGGFQHHSGNLGIDLLRDYHSLGYGTEMMRWLLDWAFEMGNLHTVSLGCFSWNTKAIRAYEAVGFERCGVEREVLWAAGKYWNHITYSMIDRDWFKIRDERRAKGLR